MYSESEKVYMLLLLTQVLDNYKQINSMIISL
jgi:hypothetical protein